MRRPLSDPESPLFTRHYAPRPRLLPGPAAGIFDAPNYCPPPLNVEWLPHIQGALNALDQIDAWSGTPEEIEAARAAIRAWLAAIEDCPE